MSGLEVPMMLALFSGGMSIYGGMEAQKSAKRAAEEQRILGEKNAAFIEAETQEEARRAQLQADEQGALSRAKAQASGTRVEGSSLDIFLGAEKDKWSDEIDWMIEAGQNRAELEKASAYSQARTTVNQGKQAFYSGITSGIGAIGGGYTANGNKFFG